MPDSPDSPAIATCRVCGCTDEQACAGGCAWLLPDLCTVCALAIEALAEWQVRGVKPDWQALQAEATEAANALRAAMSGEVETQIIVVPG